MGWFSWFFRGKSKGNFNAPEYNEIRDNSVIPTLWLPIIYIFFKEYVYLDRYASIPDLNPIKHFWDQLECHHSNS